MTLEKEITAIRRFRKPGLGCYIGTRAEWGRCYRDARILEWSRKYGDGSEPTIWRLTGLEYKAARIVCYERDAIDPLTIPASRRIAADRLIGEILEEESTAAGRSGHNEH